MILEMITIGWNNGLELRAERSRVLIDPKRTERGVPVLLTHGHRDHIPKDVKNPSSKIYATHPTTSLLTRFYGAPPESVIPLSFNETLVLGDIRITPFIAGHIIGSAMYLIEADRRRILYTGDVNPRGGFHVEGPADVPEADVVIIESTYGSPEYCFPDPHRVRAELVKWAVDLVRSGEKVLIKAYTVGKAQEVISTFNRLTNAEVVVVGEAAKSSSILARYSRLRFSLSENDPCIIITNKINPMSAGRRAIVTGWVLRRQFHGFEGFCLSSHGDFYDLIEVIRRASPQEVYTVHGMVETLANHVRREMGIRAEPLRITKV